MSVGGVVSSQCDMNIIRKEQLNSVFQTTRSRRKRLNSALLQQLRYFTEQKRKARKINNTNLQICPPPKKITSMPLNFHLLSVQFSIFLKF